MKPTHFMVVFKSDEFEIPMGADDACAGALCLSEPYLIFTSRKAARMAIDISTRYCALLRAQGSVAYNSDFSPENRKHIKIVPCQVAK